MTPEKLKIRRRELGISQRELAQELDLSAQQISNYETGRQSIPKVFDLALGQLRSAHETTASTIEHLTPQERTLVEQFVSAIKQELGRQIVFMMLFGSKVRGDFSPESDLDMLIVLKAVTPAIRRRVYDILFELDPYWEGKLSPVLYTLKNFQINEEIESPFIAQIKKEGILL